MKQCHLVTENPESMVVAEYQYYSVFMTVFENLEL